MTETCRAPESLLSGHKHANPNAEDAAFLITLGVQFIGRFLAEELGIEISDNIPLEYLAQLDIDLG